MGKKKVVIIVAIILLLVGGFLVQAVWKRAYKDGIVAYEAADCERAIQKFEQVEKLSFIFNPATMASVREKNEECLQFFAGVSEFDAQEFEEAVDSFDRFISTYPNSPNNQEAVDYAVTAHIEWALTLRENGQYEEAVEKIYSVIDKHLVSSTTDPVFQEMVTTFQEWADSLVEKGDYAQSIEVYERIIEDDNLAGYHPGIVNDIGDVYLVWVDGLMKQGGYEESANLLQDFVASYPSSTASQDVIPLLGEIYMDWGNALRLDEVYDEAVRKYGVALEKYIQSPDKIQSVNAIIGEIYLEWGNALRQAEIFDESIEKYNTALDSYLQTQEAIRDVNAWVGETYLEWGNALRQEGAYGEAIEKYELVLEAYDQTPAAVKASSDMPMIYLDIGTRQYQDGLFSASFETFEFIKTLTQDEAILTQVASEYHNAQMGLAMDTGKEGGTILSQTHISACSGEPADFPLINSDEANPGKILVCPETDDDFKVPKDLIAQYPAHLRFVTKAYLKWHTINSCSYQGGHTLHRRRYYWTVQLIDASTGVVSASNKFYGSEPGVCPPQFTFTGWVGYLSGEKPSMDFVIAWINGLLE